VEGVESRSIGLSHRTSGEDFEIGAAFSEALSSPDHLINLSEAAAPSTGTCYSYMLAKQIF